MVRQLAYADPPYPGQARRYRDGVEVNLPLLIAHLETFDGWALSTSAPALRQAWNLAPHARCAAWCKTWALNGWSRVRYSWEPVLFVTDRVGLVPGGTSTVWDSFVCAPHMGYSEVPGKGGGAKPPPVVHWIMDLLGWQPGDELHDLFPGSGAVAVAASYHPAELPLSEPQGPHPPRF